MTFISVSRPIITEDQFQAPGQDFRAPASAYYLAPSLVGAEVCNKQPSVGFFNGLSNAFGRLS